MSYSKNKVTSIQTLIQNFFLERLIQQRGVTSRTIESYRDTFKIYIKYVQEMFNISVENIDISDFSQDKVLLFLKYLEENRFILMDIYDLYNWVKVNDLNMSLYDSKKENIDKLVSDKEYISYSELEEIVNNSKYYYSLNDKIAIIDYIEILIGFNKIRRLKLQ